MIPVVMLSVQVLSIFLSKVSLTNYTKYKKYKLVKTVKLMFLPLQLQKYTTVLQKKQVHISKLVYQNQYNIRICS